MAQATNQYKRTLSGSVGAGIGSVFGGSGRKYFILEHKTNSQYHRAGETQEIIVDQIELGRDAKCQVRYDDSFGTVSRRHAAIYREGDRWKLVTLSETNSTLLNGQRVDSEVYLQNGDEIQLSSSGPKLGFIVPTGKKSVVSSIGLTRRLSLFRQQALAPYKRAITVLSVILVLVIAGGAWWIPKITNDLNSTIAELQKTKFALMDEQAKLSTLENTTNSDSVKIVRAQLDQKIAAIQASINNYSRRGSASTPIAQTGGNGNNSVKPDTDSKKQSPNASDLESCNQYVYAVFLTDLWYKLPNSDEQIDVFKRDSKFAGTGFMLKDGRFVTARHVVEGWYYYPNFPTEDLIKQYKLFNYAAFNMGKIYAKYTVVSPTRESYSFTNEQIICNRANDRTSNEDGSIYKTSDIDRYDWAYFQTPEKNGLTCDDALSTSLSQGTELFVLSYPGGIDIKDIAHIHPSYSTCVTSGTGLNSDGLIFASNINTSAGSSGGPIFAKKDGGYVVVGLHTGRDQLTGQKGVIVPISEVRR